MRRQVPGGDTVEPIDMVEATAPTGLTPTHQDGDVERLECLDTGNSSSACAPAWSRRRPR